MDSMEVPLKAIGRPIKGLYDFASVKNRYEKKILSLEGKVAVLTKDNIQTKELFYENERLRKLLLFKSRSSAKSIAAEVIARDNSSWNTFLIIDKGKKDGVAPNMPVVKAEGLLGKVFEPGNSTSRIMLIDNPNSKISAAIQRTREQGALVGIGGGLCKIVYLSYDSDVKPGDVVIESELSSLPTKGALIGEVVKVLRDSHMLYTSAIVRPACNLFKIEEVLCVE